MNAQIRERGVLPLAIPVGIFAVIGALVWLFSRVLLNVPKEVAVAIALMTAINVLAACTALAAFPRLKGGQMLPLLAVGLVPVAVGALAAAGVFGETKAEEHGGGPAAVEVTAKNLAFGSSEFKLPADADVTINFRNDEAVPHNIAIFKGSDASGEPVFKGETFTGPATRAYSFKSPPAGRYFFRCDVHPTTMTGTVVVEAGSGSEGGAGPAKVTAKATAFDKTDLTLPVGQVTVSFRNDEAIPHNISVFKGNDASGALVFRGEIFGGPATREYSFRIPEPGSYFFQCDVHVAQMKGKIVAR